MKLGRILLLMIMFVSVTVQAQDKNMQVVLYLKDGSSVRGTIIEQVPRVSLTLRTEDGNIVVYDMDEVEKYRQELFSKSFNSAKNNEQPTKKTSGYRGFVDVGYSVGGRHDNRVELLTSHGYQVLPCLFTGIGVGVQLYHSWYEYYYGRDDSIWEIPIFADIRWEPLKTPLTPFLDLKIGYTVWERTGFYMSPSIGCRFPIGDRVGFNIRLGYSIQCIERRYERYYWEVQDGRFRDYYEYWEERHNRGAFTVTIGVDF